MTMDGVPYDFTERQVYEVGQQVAAALVSLLIFTAFLPSRLQHKSASWPESSWPKQ